MIERYSREEMRNIFSDENRFKAYLEVELYATEAWSTLGVVPKEDVEKLFANAKFDLPGILELEKENKIKILKNQEFEEKFLEDTFLVVSATDNKELNDKISKLCMKKNILVNNITSQDNMNLRFMSILSNDDIQISITANGNPKKAVEVKNKIKDYLIKE